MKKSWKKLIAMILTVAFLGAMLAACSGGGGGGEAPAPDADAAALEEGGAEEGGGGGGTASANEVESGVESGTSGEGKTIGFSIASLAGNPWWQIMLDRLVSDFEAKGYEVKYADGGGDVSKQLEDIQTFIAMNVDAIVVNPYASDAVVDVSLEAEKAGIPVFACDIPIADTGYCIATFIADNWTLGMESGKAAAAKFNADKPGETMDVVILSGYPGGDDSWDRRLGYVVGLADYGIENNSSTNFNIVYQVYCNYEQEMAYEKMVDIITRFNGDFDVVYCENDAMAKGAISALQEAGLNPGDYIVQGIDGQRMAYEGIMDGSQYSTGVNSALDVADICVEGVDAYLSGDTSINGTYFTKWEIVTKDNVDKWYDPNSLF